MELSPAQLINIANEFGTPVYVYHAEKIAAQYDKLVKPSGLLTQRYFTHVNRLPM